MTTAAATPIDPAIATWDEPELRLYGGRCQLCSTVTFPRLDGCPRCGGEEIEQIRLAPRGTLWTWTSQDFPVKRPYLGADAGTFEPYLLGYVDLPDGVKVEARLVDCQPDELRIGQPMELATFVLPSTSDRGDVLGFAFRPTAEAVA
jgi:uncharacterized protein